MKTLLFRRTIIVISFLLLLSVACSLPVAAVQPTAVTETEPVQATFDALMTQTAGGQGTATQPAPIATTAVPTQAPSSTTAPTQQTWPTSTKVVLPSATYQPICDLAGFVDDISIPDGMNIAAGTSFIKTWRLKNLGACTWTPDYAVVFASGDGMGAAAAVKIGVSVLPGQVVDVSVPMKAPGQPGRARGYWQLRSAAGVLFGLGADKQPFYVDITVVPAPASGSGYDFTANLCLAQWSGNGQGLPCLGKDGDTAGFVLYQTRPILENGYVDDEPALLTNPPMVTDGVIRGKFPAYTVKTNDRFVSLVSCEYNAKKCNLRFQLDYQIDNGPILTFASWAEAYEGGVTQIDTDLSSLAGKNVSFILTVLANGASEQDRALWLMPRIVSPSTITPSPTPTVTPTVTLTPTETLPAYPYP